MKIDEEIKDAICNNDVAYFERNINRSFSINHRLEDEEGDTLLHYALSDEESDVYTFLLTMHADFNAVNDNGETLLHSIVFSGDPKRIDLLMARTNLNINQPANDGTTALLLSVLLGKDKVFKRLISLGADVNVADDSRISPLHVACQEGYLDIVKVLVDKGANIFAKTSKGNLPVSLAINNGHRFVASYLFKIMEDYSKWPKM